MSKRFGSNKSQGGKLTTEQVSCISTITSLFPDWDISKIRELCVKHDWKLDAIQPAIADILDFAQPENEWNDVKPAAKKSTNTKSSEYNSERGGASIRGGRGGIRGGLSSRPNRDDARYSRETRGDGEKRFTNKDGEEKRTFTSKDGEKRTYAKDGDRKRPAKEEKKVEEKKETKPTGPSWASIAAKGSNTSTPSVAAPVFEDYVMVDEVPVAVNSTAATATATAMSAPVAQEAVAKKPAAGVWGLNKASGASVVTGTAGVLVKEPVASPSWAAPEVAEPVYTAPVVTEEPIAAPVATPMPEPVPEPTQAAPTPAPVAAPQRPQVQRTAPGVVFSNAPAGFGNYTFGAPAPVAAVETPVQAAPAPVEAAPAAAAAPVAAPVEAEKPVETEQQPEEEYDQQHDAAEYDQSMMYNMGMGMYNNYDYPHHQQRRGGARGGGAYRPQASRPPTKAGMPMQPNMHMMYQQQQQYYGGNVKPEGYGDDRKQQQRPAGQPMSGKHSPVSAPQQQYQQGPNDMMLPGGKKPYQANPNVGGYNKQYPKNNNYNPQAQAGGNPKAKNPMNQQQQQHYYQQQNMHMQYPPYGMYNYPQYPYGGGYNRNAGYNHGYYPEPYYHQQGEEDYSQGQDGQAQAPQQGQQDYEWDNKDKKDRRPQQQQQQADFGANAYGYNQYMPQQQNPNQHQQQQYGNRY